MDNQTNQIALSPDLGLTPEAFATEWNETAETRAIAHARLSTAKGTQFDATLVAGILISVATNLASSALYDLIKQVIQQLQDKKGTQHPHQQKHTHIEELEKPDGTHLWAVEIDEE